MNRFKFHFVFFLSLAFSSQCLGAVLLYNIKERAAIVPFDNSTNGFAATDVQAAIEEAKATAEGKARWVVLVGFDGNASTGRWLEFLTNVSSNVSGYVLPKPAYMLELAASCESSTTVTFTFYKQVTTVIETLTLTSTRKTTKNVNVSLASLDELSAKITSGSCSKPNVGIHLRYQ